MDDQGLASYAQWLSEHLGSRDVLREQLISLGPHALPTLEAAVQEAAAFAVQSVETYGAHHAKRRNARKLLELVALVAKVVPESSALFPRLFAERVICDQYKRAQAAARARDEAV